MADGGAVAVRGGGWAAPLAAGTLGLLALLLLFAPEAAAAIGVWESSSAFGHCFLVLPIALWLAWDRRDQLVRVSPRPLPAAALLALPPIAAWLVAERLGLMEGRQLTAVALVWVLALAAFGPRAFAALSAPLFFLVFLVPFGAFLVPALQDVTARFIDVGLGLLAIPHEVNQIFIEIPEGRFMVAEACAGLRFLIASIAFGTLYALTLYRSPGCRAAFIAVSIVVPVLANGIRALGIVVLGHLRGSAEAGAVDHVLYGWIFFSAVILLLILLGLPFREDAAPCLPPLPRPATRRPAAPGAAVATLLVLALACLGPAAAWGLSRGARAEQPPHAALPAFPLPPGCRGLPTPGDYACGPATLHLTLRPLGPHADAALAIAALRADIPPAPVVDGEEEDIAHATLATANGTWRIDSTDQPPAASAAAIYLGDGYAAGGLRDRAALAWSSLTGRHPPATVVSIAARGGGADAAARAMAAAVPAPME